MGTTAIATAPVGELRSLAAKQESQLERLRSSLRDMKEASQSAGGLALQAASVAGGASVAGLVDGAVLGEKLWTTEPLMRPSTLLSVVLLGGAVAMGSQHMALAAAGAATAGAYLKGAQVGYSLRDQLSRRKAEQTVTETAQKVAV